MKTLQKIIWPTFLTIGLMSITSCGDRVDNFHRTDFIYKNNSAQILKIKLYNEENKMFTEYVLNDGEEKIISMQEDGDKNGICQPFRLQNDTDYIATKVILEFANNTCVNYENYSGVLDYKNYDNYNPSMKNNSENTLIFNIDSGELNLATTCQ